MTKATVITTRNPSPETKPGDTDTFKRRGSDSGCYSDGNNKDACQDYYRNLKMPERCGDMSKPPSRVQRKQD